MRQILKETMKGKRSMILLKSTWERLCKSCKPSGVLGTTFLGFVLALSLGFMVHAQNTTTTSVSCTPDPVGVSQPTTCTATVTDTGGTVMTPITGAVTFTTSGSGSFTGNPCTLSGAGNPASCSVTFTPTSAGTHTITGSYGGDANHTGSSGMYSLTVKRVTLTTVTCSETPLVVNEQAICTVTVDDTSTGTPSTPTGTVTFSSSPPSEGSFSSTTCTLNAVGQCTVNYTPSSGDTATHTITASYGGDSNFLGSSDTFDQAVVKRAADVELSCTPSNVFINQMIACTVNVVDDTTVGTSAIPTGSVSFDDGGKAGTFSAAGCTLSSGTCSVNYTPAAGDAGTGFDTTTITATYGGSLVHQTSSDTQQLTVNLRPSETSVDCLSDDSGNHETLFVNETATCTVTVKDNGPSPLSAPTGSVTITTSLGGSPFSSNTCGALTTGSGQSTCTFKYTRTSLALDGDFDTIGAIYNGSTTFAPSAGGFAQGVQRRTTSTAISCGNTSSCTATVTDVAIRGTKSNPSGSLVKADTSMSTLCSSLTPSGLDSATCSFTATISAIMVNVTAIYEPNDNVHIKSTGGDNITTPAPTGSSGEKDVWTIRHALNSACLAANVAALAMDAIALAIDPSPDPVVGVGAGLIVVVVTGVTIPTSDILSTIFGVAKVILQAFVLTACTDLDGDGLFGVIELDIGTSDANPDTDGDAMTDGSEIDNALGQFGGGACPNPTKPDSDEDGVMDGSELSYPVPTSPCTADTDNDSIPDGIEFASGISPILSNGFYVSTPPTATSSKITQSPTWPGVLSTAPTTNPGQWSGLAFPFTDTRLQSNPQQQDTDGDSISDGTEFGQSCSLTSGTVLGSYVNDADSDDDGYQDFPDNDADVGPAAGNGGELNDDSTPSVCDSDSDGDGIQDGTEVNQGTNRLDWDSDDDGLSDREEIQIYFTDPNNPDTDGDTADGVIAARAPASIPVLTGHSGTGTIECLSDCEEALSATAQFNNPPNPLDETDPLQIDTDGDGINDNIEFNPGCNDGPGGPGTGTALFDGFANSFDSDADGLRDAEDAVGDVPAATGINNTPSSRAWTTFPETPTPTPGGTKTLGADGVNDGELNDDILTGICDPDSDGDGVLDGAERQIGSDPFDWDTDDDGRDDREFLGGGPIPSDPLDFDTDDDGLGDGVEVFSVNTTNPVNADTDGDGLCDGGGSTPSFGIDGSGTNPLCFGGTGSVGGIGDHPNPLGLGEDENGNGTVDAGETDPNQFDTDGDAEGDGVEKLGFSTSRQFMIPTTDLRGRPINVFYPTTGCMDPLDPDTDDDGLDDGFEDFNHDGNWDFLPSDFDHEDPIPGPVRPEPEETNPCDADSDDDGLNDFLERNQPNPPAVFPFNPTNPLDHDTDNDLMFDGEEVFFVCAPAPAIPNLDNDGDGSIDEDPVDGVDNDLDGKFDEDDVDFTVLHIDFLDPTNRDSDSDGFIDGLDIDPCNSPLIPILQPFVGVPPPDSDGDGFADDDELAAGTDPKNPDSHPHAFPADLDRDGEEDDRLWLEDPTGDGIADTVALDVNSNVQVDARIQLIPARDFVRDDFDGDGSVDDCRYKIVYAFSNQRVLQPRVLLTIFDFDCDLKIDRVEFESVK